MLALTRKEGEIRMSTAMDRRNLLKFGVAATAALGATTLPTLARAATPALWKRYKPGVDAVLRHHERIVQQKRKQFERWWQKWRQSGTEQAFARLLRSGN